MALQTLILYMCLATNGVDEPLNCTEINSAWVPFENKTLGAAINFNPHDLTILINKKLAHPEIPLEYLLGVITHELAHLKSFKSGTSDGHGPRFVSTCMKMSTAIGLDGRSCAAVYKDKTEPTSQ